MTQSPLPYRTLVHPGEYGPFEGADADQVVFGHYRQHGTWSPAVLDLLTARIGAEPGTLLDVGANIGLVSIPFVQRTGSRAFAFEPAPMNFELLKRNVERHGLSNRITLFEVAAHERETAVSMRLSPDNFGDHQVLPGTDSGEIEVRANSIDALLEGTRLTGHVAMKIDTQGCEAKVLRGARETLKQVSTLIVEYWPKGLARMGNTMADVNAELMDFTHGRILPQSGKLPKAVPAQELLNNLQNFLKPADEGFFDILLTRDS